MLQSCLECLQTDGNSEFNCTVVISLSHLLWKPFPGRRGSQPQSELKSVLPVGLSSAVSALVWWQLLSVILQSCLLRLPLASGRLGHVRDLTHVCVGFGGMLRFFFVERDLLTLIFIVNGAEEHLSTSSMNRVFCVWVRGRIPAAS